MNLLISFDAEELEEALARARTIKMREPSRSEAGLNTIVLDEATRWAGRIWEAMEDALRNAASQGYAAARDAMAVVGAKIDEAAIALKDQIQDVIDMLRKRLDQFLQDEIDLALRRVKARVQIGDRSLVASGAAIQQTVKLTGTLKTKLDDICSFLAEGQIAVTVNYSATDVVANA